MPIHDWTRVSAGIWHDFHLAWIAEIRGVLNESILPEGYYALTEQIAGPLGPDVLALERPDGSSDSEPPSSAHTSSPAIALLERPPLPKRIAECESGLYLSKRRRIVVRHSSGDRVVALVDIVSPGNKESRHGITSFVEKATEALSRGYHLLIVDLFPRNVRNPNGIHAEIWREVAGVESHPPHESGNLTLVSYSSGATYQAYLEPTRVGAELIDMPLFLEPDLYVEVPLEATYRDAYRRTPRRWKEVLEKP
jgi:hypothetical protein